MKNSILAGLKRRRNARALVVRIATEETGSVAIETTLAYILMITLVLGIIEFSIMGYTYSVFAEAARQGVRYATFHGAGSTSCSGPSTGCGDPSGSNVANNVTQYANNFAGSVTSLNIKVTYPDGSSTAPSRVVVTVAYTYQPMFNIPGLAQTFSVTSQGRILY